MTEKVKSSHVNDLRKIFSVLINNKNQGVCNYIAPSILPDYFVNEKILMKRVKYTSEYFRKGEKSMLHDKKNNRLLSVGKSVLRLY